MATTDDYDFLFKFIFIGVGKSSLLLRFSDNTFTSSDLATIGVNFKIRNLDLQQKTIKCQILDTSEQEHFRTISSAYQKGAHGIILVYDITDKESFKNIENCLTENVVKMLVGNKNDLKEKRSGNENDGQWHYSYLQYRQSFKDIENWLTDVKKYVNENVVTLLVGNKSDLEEQRQVSQDEGQQMAKTLGVQFLEVIAKTGFNVEKVFITVAEDILERIQKQYDVMLIYDITDKESFKNIENWLTEAEKYADEDVVKMLVGNKNDLEEKRSVNESDGQQMAKTHGISFLEASAQNACNVEKVFETIAEEIIGRIKKQDDVKPIQNEY